MTPTVVVAQGSAAWISRQHAESRYIFAKIVGARTCRLEGEHTQSDLNRMCRGGTRSALTRNDREGFQVLFGKEPFAEGPPCVSLTGLNGTRPRPSQIVRPWSRALNRQSERVNVSETLMITLWSRRPFPSRSHLSGSPQQPTSGMALYINTIDSASTVSRVRTPCRSGDFRRAG